ncbi:unnamed protein product [Orchesella dallaii]|uniref:Gustatory receptor n=1 Tax=Orchesella dallaii TaxID=48710 RepID=A0ABP1R1S7_9HEXA
MLTKLQAASFHIYKLCYCYYPPLPITWDPITLRLVITSSLRTWLIFLYTLFNAFLVGMGNFYVVITHFNVKKRAGLKFTHIFLFITGGCFVLTLCILTVIILRRIKDAQKGYNELTQLSFQMLQKFRPVSMENKKKTKIDKMGMLMCAITLSLSLPVPIIILFVVFGHFDIVTFIAGDILPLEMLQLTATRLMLYFLRFWIVGMAITEGFRCLAFFLPIAAMGLLNYLSCVKTLNKMVEVDTFLRYYLYLGANYMMIQRLLGDVAVVVIGVAFWGTVGAIWVVVKGYEVMQPLFYGCLVTGVIICLLSTGVFMSMLKVGITLQEQMVEKRRIEAEEMYMKRKTKHSKYVWKRMIAMRPIQFWFGTFMPLSVKFAIEYVRNLVERVMDFVLMFDMSHINI